MSFLGKTHLVIVWTVDPEDEATWDRLFASHASWMLGHPRDGETALLSYTISKGPEQANPLDPESAATGKTVFVLDEYYASPSGVSNHWAQAMAQWAEDLGAIIQASAKATVMTMHSGTVVHALW